MSVHSDQKKRIEQMHSDLNEAARYRKRAQATGHLQRLLSAELPAYKSAVAVKGGRWWRRWRDDSGSPKEEEIILTDEERREFRDWLYAKEQDHARRAEEIELRYAGGK